MPPSSPAADAWPGRLVGGRWRILSLLDDSGGMASVYLAEDERLPRKAVVKIPRAAQFNAEFAERFQREAFWHAKVENLHVVHILDRGEEEGTPYLVLQYLPGGNLKAWCAGNPSMLCDPRLHYDAWLLPIAQALDAVAAQGIVHRDVKPSNILFDASGQAYLSDFGIVKAGNDATMTGTGLFIGTLQFMSPEQCQNERVALDGRSDQYGLAVTAYQVLTGWKYPTRDDTAVVYAAKFGHTRMTEPREHEPRVPPAVNAVVMRALATDRDKRFRSSVEFVDAVMLGMELDDTVGSPSPIYSRPVRLSMDRASDTVPRVRNASSEEHGRASREGRKYSRSNLFTQRPTGWNAAATLLEVVGVITLCAAIVVMMSNLRHLEVVGIAAWHMLYGVVAIIAGLQMLTLASRQLLLVRVAAVMLITPVWLGFFPIGMTLGCWLTRLLDKREWAALEAIAEPQQ